MMKNIIYVLFLSLLISCGQSTHKVETTVERVTTQDSLEIAKLTREYLEHLKRQEFDAALSMLHEVKLDSAYALSEASSTKIRMQYQSFPVLSYHIDSYELKGVKNSEVQYSICFFEKEEGDTHSNTMRFHLNPRKVKGKWYLGLLNR